MDSTKVSMQPQAVMNLTVAKVAISCYENLHLNYHFNLEILSLQISTTNKICDLLLQW